MKNLSLTTKILSLCIGFILPTAALAYLLVAAYDKDIDFAANEIRGTKALAEIHKALYLTYRASLLEGEERANALNQLSDVMEKVDEQMTDNIDYLKLSAEEMDSRGRPGSTVADLKKKHLGFAKSPDDAAAYDALVGNFNTLIVHIGDTSNLILDPDLDTYYLMDLFLLAIPGIESRLATYAQQEKTIGNSRELTMDQRMEYKANAKILRDIDLARVIADLETALKEDKNFFGTNDNLQNKIPKVEKKVEADLAPIIAAFEQRASTGLVGANLTALMVTFLDDSSSFWDLTDATMIQMLEARTGHYKGLQRQALVIAVIAILLLLVIGVFTVKAIVGRLSRLAESVKKQSLDVAHSSASINNSAQDLSNSATEQSAAIEETVASTEEMTAMLAQTGHSADHSLSLSRQSIERSDSGRDTMQRLEAAMNHIEASNRKLEDLTNVIAGIQSKTKVINDIVFETRLLSVNASIEAARAGVHGKGFAVVAEEVGKLAAMSGTAANEINQLLANSSKQVREIVSETTERSNAGVHVAQEAKADFLAISDLLRNILDATEKIVAATKEQEVGIKQTNQAMSEMDQATQQNANNANRLSEQSEKLNQSSQDLKTSVMELSVILHGHAVDTRVASLPSTAFNEKKVAA